MRNLDTGDWIALRAGHYASAPTLADLVTLGIPIHRTREAARAMLTELAT